MNLDSIQVHSAAMALVEDLRPLLPLRIWGIPRGGVPVAYLLASIEKRLTVVNNAAEADVIVDDIYDTGKTMKKVCRDLSPKVLRAVLISKVVVPVGVFVGHFIRNSAYIVFPWEKNDIASAEDVPIRLIQFIGDDATREGLQETPSRFLKAWKQWGEGYSVSEDDIATILKTFEDGSEDYDQFVVVKDIPIYSHCEHHLAPFFGTASIGYIPNKRILGLSKFVRLAEVYSRRLQVQERLTRQIANALFTHLTPKAVGVVLKCRHMCMESRGVKTAGSLTITSAIEGLLRTDAAAKEEFFNLIKE